MVQWHNNQSKPGLSCINFNNTPRSSFSKDHEGYTFHSRHDTIPCAAYITTIQLDASCEMIAKNLDNFSEADGQQRASQFR